MKMLYRFDEIDGNCASCGFSLGETAWLLLEPSIDPDAFAAQNGMLCAECVLNDLTELDSPWEIRQHEHARR